MEMPTTLLEAIRYFSDEQTCINAVAYLRWEDGSPVCPKCNAAQGERNPHGLAKQKRWKCYQCYKQFSVKVGTIFEDSPISLSKWLPAMWLLVNCKNGVSSYEVSRDLGLSQQAAWFVLQRVRHIFKDTTVIPMRGPVEVDESFHGGKPKNMHRSRRLRLQVGENGYSEKTAVFGILDRETRKVRAQVVPNVKPPWRSAPQTSALVRLNHIHLAEARRRTAVADRVDLLRLPLAVVGRAPLLPIAGSGDQVERLPEVGGARLVGDPRNHPLLLAVLDLPKSIAAELKIVALLVDREAAIAIDQDAVVHAGDQVVDTRPRLARLQPNVGHALERNAGPVVGIAAAARFALAD